MANPATNWTGANINALGNGNQVSDAKVFKTPQLSVMMFDLTEQEIRAIQNNPRLCVVQLGSTIHPIGLGTEQSVREMCVDMGKIWSLERPDDLGQTPNEQRIEVLETQNRLLSDLMKDYELQVAKQQKLIDEHDLALKEANRILRSLGSRTV